MYRKGAAWGIEQWKRKRICQSGEERPILMKRIAPREILLCVQESEGIKIYDPEEGSVATCTPKVVSLGRAGGDGGGSNSPSRGRSI